MAWRHGSMVKNIYCSYRASEFVPSTTMSGSQWPVAPVPGHPIPSCDLCRLLHSCVQISTDIHKHTKLNTQIHIVKMRENHKREHYGSKPSVAASAALTSPPTLDFVKVPLHHYCPLHFLQRREKTPSVAQVGWGPHPQARHTHISSASQHRHFGVDC